MAMERQLIIRDTHTRTITALGYNPARRELMAGCEDGYVKTWEADTGKVVSSFREHAGWVTDFIYWSDTRLVLSSANDGLIIAWGSGGGVTDKVEVGCPVYAMAINPRRQQLLCGVKGGIQVYDMDEERVHGHFILNKLVYMAREHTDIVRCVVCHESRVYSAGYDQKLIFYDSPYAGEKAIIPSFINPHAHDAGICTLMLVKDNENNTWIVTGSFDKTVKIWAPDGQLVHKLDGFISTVTGVCYVPRNKTIWAAGGTSYAYLYDPKSGDNISDFVGSEEEEEIYPLVLLKYFPELNSVVASTSRRHLKVWKYNSSGCCTTLKCKVPQESLAYTKKVPILLFSGDNEGCITKWERMQSNHFMYSKEHFPLSDGKSWQKQKKAQNEMGDGYRLRTADQRQRAVSSRYAYRSQKKSYHDHANTNILKIVFVEELDLIVAGCEDSNIYVWGFDEDAVKALKNMEQPDAEKNLIHKYGVLLHPESQLLRAKKKVNEEDSVTNRVAGFVCRYVLENHTSCVTSLCAVPRSNGSHGTYVLSAGWDRRICIWNLEEGVLHDTFRGEGADKEKVEIACDGIITDMAFCLERNEFAYASSDKMIYIRKFSPKGHKMVLLNTLQGHIAEVTTVNWSSLTEKWITGSEDATIRVWSSDDLNECEQELSVQGGVSCLTIDSTTGAIVAGVQEYIKVFEPQHYRLVQTNVGHTDCVRSIIHIPERSQYVSCGWDKTLRVWNCWAPPRTRISKKLASKEEKSTPNKKEGNGGNQCGKQRRSKGFMSDIVEDDEFEITIPGGM